MKLMKMMLCLGTLTVAIASAESRFNLKLSSAAWVGNTELQPGNYKIEIQGDKAVFTSGKTVAAQAPATVVNDTKKYRETAVDTSNSKITSIELGGTSTKIVLKTSESAVAGN